MAGQQPSLILPERITRRGSKRWQTARCFIRGHQWTRGPWCERCGRLEHYR